MTQALHDYEIVLRCDNCADLYARDSDEQSRTRQRREQCLTRQRGEQSRTEQPACGNDE
jgi:hypothetical protein